VFLVDSTEFGRATYWQVDHAPPYAPLGWVAGENAGDSTLTPFRPLCPPDESVTAATIAELGGAAALVCFGNRQLNLVGDLSCVPAAVDAIVGGPAWLRQDAVCSLDDQLGLAGDAVFALRNPPAQDRVEGRFVIRGHFDDPKSDECGWIAFGTSGLEPSRPGEPGPVLICRQQFVVTAAERLRAPSPS
jgi:hypothetical protein